MKEPALEKFLRRLRLRRLNGWIPAGSTLLDIGCGWECRLLRTYANRIEAGYGMDFKVELEDLPFNIRAFSHRFEVLPWPVPNSSIDVVTMLAVLEHIWPDDLANVFRGIHSALKPGGSLLITVPTPTAKPVLEFLAYKAGVINEDEIRDHKVYYNQSLLNQTLQQEGFQITKYQKFQLGFNSFCVAKKA